MASRGPLAGVKVIELGGLGPGPHAGMCSPTWAPTWCGCDGPAAWQSQARRSRAKRVATKQA